MSTSQTAERSMPWWVVLVAGIAAVVLGIVLLFNTAQTVIFLARLVGIYWLVSGILTLFQILRDKHLWGLRLIGGILAILAGLIVLFNPLFGAVITTGAIVIIIGGVGVAAGIINIIEAVQGGGWGIAVLGVLSLLFGVVLIFNPVVGAIGLALVLAVIAVVAGLAAIIIAFRMR